MALKATRLIREAEGEANLYRAAELLRQARDWAEAHHQPRLAATAKRLLAENYIRRHCAV